MGRIRWVLAAVIVLVPLTAVRADAVTIRDIVELSKAGLSDDIILALIEVDRPVFSIDTQTLKMLKGSGVSEAVILAMIRSGRTRTPEPIDPQFDTPPPAPANPEPQVIVIDHHDAPVVQQVPVPVPVAVPVFVTVPRRVLPFDQFNRPVSMLPFDQFNRPVSLPVGNDLSPRNSDLSPRPIQSDRHPCTTPVYWGFGGKLRPDSWQPPQVCR